MASGLGVWLDMGFLLCVLSFLCFLRISGALPGVGDALGEGLPPAALVEAEGGMVACAGVGGVGLGEVDGEMAAGLPDEANAGEGEEGWQVDIGDGEQGAGSIEGAESGDLKVWCGRRARRGA